MEVYSNLMGNNSKIDIDEIYPKPSFFKRVDTANGGTQITTENDYQNPTVIYLSENIDPSAIYAVEFKIASNDSRTSNYAFFQGYTGHSNTGVICGAFAGNLVTCLRIGRGNTNELAFYRATGTHHPVYVARVYKVQV